jgi:hypothetical protein
MSIPKCFTKHKTVSNKVSLVSFQTSFPNLDFHVTVHINTHCLGNATVFLPFDTLLLCHAQNDELGGMARSLPLGEAKGKRGHVDNLPDL